MNKTFDAVTAFVRATNASKYQYKLVNPETEAVKHGLYNPEQFLKAVPFFQAHNLQGFNIYCRPIGYEYVLLDDLKRDVLADLSTLQPCALLETSPDNFQAWVHLADVPETRDGAKRICRQLAQRFNADPASAEPDHIGRVPGFTNRKPQYQTGGLFPYVVLRRWADRLSTLCIDNSEPAEPEETGSTKRTGGGGYSEHDFGVAVGMLRNGFNEDQIYDRLLKTSPNLKGRKGRYTDQYLRRTISNAQKQL